MTPSPAGRMPIDVLARLWVMVFVHYFVWGSWYVTMGTYLTKTLHFSGEQVGLAYGSTAVGAMVSPFFAGIVADRFMPTQRLLGLLHLAGAGLLYWISTLTSFAEFYPVLLLYTVTYMAGHGLTNTQTLHHARDVGRDFPLVMIMGSVGWIAAGLAVSNLKLENSPDMFRLAAGAALFMGVYSFTLPHTPAKGAGSPKSLRTLFGLDAIGLLRDRSFAVFMLCSLVICIPLSFYFNWMNLFMTELKIEYAAAKMTIAQVSDVVFLLLLPVLLPRLGVKGVLLLGMTAWAARFALFTWAAGGETSQAPLYLGIALHGMCYDFIFVMGRMYVDRHADEKSRGAAQGLHALVTLGVGMFIGTWFAGVVGGHYAVKVDETVTHQWQSIWVIPAVLALVMAVVFLFLFRESRRDSAAAAAPVA